MLETNDITILSVSDLNAATRQVLEREFAVVWVEGELSNFVQAASGHWYFSLKDDKAQIRCAMFRQANRQWTTPPQAGQKVLVRAKVSLYAPRGDYQLIVSHMEEAGLGALHRAFEQLKQKLQQEGLFASEHKQDLPSSPQTIGVVTSASGAAIHDILHVMQRRAPHINIIIYPSLVQGEQAASNIAKMIATANQLQQCDVLIVGRGGGSLEDLWAFNEETVARAIFASRIPIISAVGHEVDVSIADFVADLRAPTPSAAAELISEDGLQLCQTLDYYSERLQQLMLLCLQQKRHQFDLLQQRCQHPRLKLQSQSARLVQLHLQLQHACRLYFQTQRQQLLHTSQRLHSLSPLATLQRGYAILKDANTQGVLKQVTQIKPQQQLHAQLQDGHITCQVIATQRET